MHVTRKLDCLQCAITGRIRHWHATPLSRRFPVSQLIPLAAFCEVEVEVDQLVEELEVDFSIQIRLFQSFSQL
jgi:hypothetical protein